MQDAQVPERTISQLLRRLSGRTEDLPRFALPPSRPAMTRLVCVVSTADDVPTSEYVRAQAPWQPSATSVRDALPARAVRRAQPAAAHLGCVCSRRSWRVHLLAFGLATHAAETALAAVGRGFSTAAAGLSMQLSMHEPVQACTCLAWALLHRTR